MLQKDKIIAEAKDTCDTLRELRTQNLAAIRQKNRIHQGMLHVTHRLISSDEEIGAEKGDFKDNLKKTSAKLKAYFKDGTPVSDNPGVLDFINTFKVGAIPFEKFAGNLEKLLAKEAVKLPVAEWWCSHQGLGIGGLGKIVGDAGYIGTYRRPSGLWKRMGLMNVRIPGKEPVERTHTIAAPVLDEFEVLEVLHGEFDGKEFQVTVEGPGDWYLVGDKLVRTPDNLGESLESESIRLTIRCVTRDGKVARACGHLKKAELTKEEWVDIGYSPQRRSTLYTITDSLLKKQLDLTPAAKKLGDSSKKKDKAALAVMYPTDRWTPNGVYGEFAIKRRVDIHHRRPDWSPSHRLYDMHRVLAKRLLEDLFYKWKSITGEPIDYSRTWE